MLLLSPIRALLINDGTLRIGLAVAARDMADSIGQIDGRRSPFSDLLGSISSLRRHGIFCIRGKESASGAAEPQATQPQGDLAALLRPRQAIP
jgi:hypothetical protein